MSVCVYSLTDMRDPRVSVNKRFIHKQINKSSLTLFKSVSLMKALTSSLDAGTSVVTTYDVIQGRVGLEGGPPVVHIRGDVVHRI